MIKKYSAINQYFDQVYVLNLEKHPDRKIAMLQKLGRLGISAEFVQAIDGNSFQNKLEHKTYLEQPIGTIRSHPLEISQQRKLITSPGAWGYLKTYLGILHDAKKREYKRILCLDDDVLFHKDFENQFIKGTQTIFEDWKLFFLGASQYVWKIPEDLSYPNPNKKEIDSNEPFYIPNKTDGSFAIGINHSVFDILIQDIVKMNCPFDSGPLRTVIETYPKSCFVLQPNIVIADVYESDILEGQDQEGLAEQLRWNMDAYEYPSPQDLVSVIMPAYNAERTIEKSIRSILMQSYQTLELIVVNDASSDNTVNIVDQLMKEDSRIKLISLSTNKGVGRARNEGIKASKGNIIAFQDADDISLKNRLAYQLIPIYERGMLFSVCRFYRTRCTIDELDIEDQQATMSLVKSRRVKTKHGLFEYRDRSRIALVTAVYKRSVFEEFGLFENHRFGEDLEFLERILFYKLHKEFDEDNNGYSYLTKHSSIANTFARIDLPLYLSPEMDDVNLTVQFEKNEKDRLRILKEFRKKHRITERSHFSKLPKHSIQKNLPEIRFSTLKLDTIVLLPKVEHQMLLSQIEQAKEAEKMYAVLDGVYNSLSWRITAPLRWILDTLKKYAPFK